MYRSSGSDGLFLEVNIKMASFLLSEDKTNFVNFIRWDSVNKHPLNKEKSSSCNPLEYPLYCYMAGGFTRISCRRS